MIVEVKTQVTILPFRLHWIVRIHIIVKQRSLSAGIVLFLCQISLRTSNHLPPYYGAVDDLVEAYNSGVNFLINKHAPLQKKTITLRPNAPWYTENTIVGKLNDCGGKQSWRSIISYSKKDVVK